ncbi:hypothetical protein RND71_004715 [Anisodus tanguticus]|uniref:Uncharacterized protein n=1 Tax=Anisodus tanguticus TaxID=243964 RepID=A0AAE1SML7_9SOLA|nr:hypothetical protein RND71_004715 [Anisodus tanguticus]
MMKSSQEWRTRASHRVRLDLERRMRDKSFGSICPIMHHSHKLIHQYYSSNSKRSFNERQLCYILNQMAGHRIAHATLKGPSVVKEIVIASVLGLAAGCTTGMSKEKLGHSMTCWRRARMNFLSSVVSVPFNRQKIHQKFIPDQYGTQFA